MQSQAWRLQLNVHTVLAIWKGALECLEEAVFTGGKFIWVFSLSVSHGNRKWTLRFKTNGHFLWGNIYRGKNLKSSNCQRESENSLNCAAFPNGFIAFKSLEERSWVPSSLSFRKGNRSSTWKCRDSDLVTFPWLCLEINRNTVPTVALFSSLELI